MRILAKKLDEDSNSSAVIVSHDMHLAIEFADIIIKIRKAERESKIAAGEKESYGIINDNCVYYPTDETRTIWTNGIDEYKNADFEIFLRKK
jgi:energy-coupling factor transporter ATP-binding protein EcfA2